MELLDTLVSVQMDSPTHTVKQVNIITRCLDWHLEQVRIQDFNIERAQKMSSAHDERKAQSPFNSGGVHRAGLKALEAAWFENTLSCYLRLILKDSDTKLNSKQHSRSKFRGGGGGRLLRPRWIRHCLEGNYISTDNNYISNKLYTLIITTACTKYTCMQTDAQQTDY